MESNDDDDQIPKDNRMHECMHALGSRKGYVTYAFARTD